ncbi:uncharacterized protein [Hetaerina americana]|uniref:uncharacterized protein n=1 Tax=Hetaerina americana TaxID=62018 RepID=UPI003A7F17A6
MEEVVLLPGTEADGAVRWEGKFVWDRRHVLELIKEYRNMENEFKDHTIKRKVIWRKIAQNMKKNGICVSWELCDKKWRNLKQTFRAIRTSKRSDISMRRWEFYSELEGIFKNDETLNRSIMSPVDTHGEAPDDSVDVMSEIDDCSDREINDEEGETNTKDNYSTEDSVSRSKMRECDVAPWWFKEFLISYREDDKARTAMVETMMQDIVKLEDRKCQLLEHLCEMISHSK